MTLETVVSTGPQTLGWAYLDLSDDVRQWGLYHSFTTYRKQTPGQPDLMTSVPFVDGLESDWIVPFDNTGGKYPGVALVNTSKYSPNTFTFEVFDLSGRLIKTFTRTVAPLAMDWFSLLGDYPELASAEGQIKVTGGFYSSALLTLQFAPNGAFTALPVVSTYGMTTR